MLQKAPRPIIFKREGGAFSSGNSILMQRERGKQKERQKQKKAKVRAVGKIGGTEAGVGRGWSGRRARVDRSGKVGRIKSVRLPIKDW